MTPINRISLTICLLIGFLTLSAQSSLAQERLCDPAFEDCREPLWRLIDQETVGLDVAFWFMQDSSFSNKIIARHNAGVPVRILVDPRANPIYSGNEAILNQLASAGIPMRKNVSGGILHWKMMLFAGQNTVQFSGANYSAHFFTPTQPFTNYIDEAIYFTSDPSVVNSFKTKYDDLWTDTAHYATFANISGPLLRRYPVLPIDPEMNFPPRQAGEEFVNRTLSAYNQEQQKIDVIMYRITDRRYSDAMIAAKARGLTVRLLTEPQEYRNPDKFWHSWNVDRMYMGGVEIRQRKATRLGLNHEKAVMLYSQGLTIFGSSNWTTSSSNSQEEHNYFTRKAWFFDWFVNHFERKWNSATENEAFVPLPPPVAPAIRGPSNGASGQATSGAVLRWDGERYAHKYDIYFGTEPNPPLHKADHIVFLDSAYPGVEETYQLPALQAGTTYYWRIVSKTMANMGTSGPVWSFTTAGTPPPPSNPPTITSVLPNTGSVDGGRTVEITGTNFAAGATVTFGGVPATEVTIVSSTTITAKTPAHAEGAVDVVVRNTNNLSGTLAQGFTYMVTPPPPPPTEGEVVLYAAEAPLRVGGWAVVSDPLAAGGARLHLPDAGRPKVGEAAANPGQYFEMTFEAQAGRAYRLWIRGKAQNDHFANDSVLVQFSGSVDQNGAPIWRIGTTSGEGINLEDCSGCGLQGWGWQDNGWGVGVFGQVLYFATTGPQTIRIQNREDGLSIDQIVLSSSRFLTTSPGALKNDTVILPKSSGEGPPPAAPPTVTQVSPNSGPTDGGTAITITGTGFANGASVTVGGSAATGVTVASATSITATTPAHAEGAADVVVTNPDNQTGTLSSGFTYNAPPAAPPTVSAISPNSGSASGGTAVTITGTGFATGASVTIGGAPATGVTVVNETTINATTPAHEEGVVDVVVRNADNQSGTLAGGFTYDAPSGTSPTISAVSPNSGPTDGGTAITITGTYFAEGATVTVGGTAATGVTVVNETTINAITPAHAAGAVNVVVTNLDNQSGTLTGGFTYNAPPAPPPTVSAISPNSGSTAGGTAVTITGTGFATGASVTIGGAPATGVTVVNGMTINATTPAHSAGSVDVVVTNADSQSGTLSGGFTYSVPPSPAPTITSISPNAGSMNGGTAITITGTGFANGASVTVGGSAATGVTVVSATSITATTPAHAEGAADVVVTNPDNQTGTLAGGFTYTASAPVNAPEVVLYASEAPVTAGGWTVVTDSSAAGGSRLHLPDAGAAKVSTPLATPTKYFEMTFQAEAGRAYRLWIRGKAQNDFWGNDSVFIQFSGSVNSSGGAVYRIGTATATEMNLEDCSGCGLQGWGWQDNGWGVGVMGPLIYFETTGPQTIRIQNREDGLSIDQIVLSPHLYLTSSPGALKNDATILQRSQ